MMVQATDMTLRISRRPSLADAAAERLREAIVEGRLVQGQHLTEVGTAAELGISRGPLREAFKMLATEGLLEIRDGRGVFVASHAPEEIAQMVVARAMIEGMAARLFVLNATPQERQRVIALVEEMVAAAEAADSRSSRAIDWTFHEAMVTGSGNQFLLSSWRNLGTLLRVYMMQLNPLYDRERSRVLATHRRLAEVLNGDDPGKAERMFRSTIILSGFKVLGRDPIAGLVDPAVLDEAGANAP